jgi:PGF-pre-PGF domain-containing protein
VVEALDNSSNRANTSALTITVDSTVPVSNLNLPADETWTTSTTPTLSFNVTDNLDNVINYSIIIDGSVVNASWVTNNTEISHVLEVALSEAVHSIVVESMDEAGNRANSSVVTLYVDATNPQGEITSPSSGNTTDNTPTLVFNLTDNVDTALNYTVFINGNSANAGIAVNGTEETVGLGTLSDGSYTVVVEVLDNASNRVNSSAIYLTIDSTSPVVYLNSPTNNSEANDLSVEFIFNATDNMDMNLSYTLFINDTANRTGYTQANNTVVTFTESGFTNGYSYSWFVEVADDAGNAVNYSGVWYFTINDTTAPDTAPVIAQAGVNDSDNDGNVELVWTTDVYAASYKVYRHSSEINNATSLSAIGSTALTAFEDNTTVNGTTYWYAVTSLDTAGNENASLVSTSYNATANDQNKPKLATNFNASTLTTGAIYLDWSATVADVLDQPEVQVTYRIFRNVNVTLINTTAYSNDYVANTTDYNYTHTNLTTGINYTYVITVVDDANNFNNTNASRIAYESSSCSADYNYGAWSDCSSSEKSRTGTRTCYGGGSSTSTQTESCTSSTSSSSGSSTTSGTVAATAPRSSMAWMNVAKGEKVHLEITKEEIGVTSIELTVNAAKTFMQLTVEKLDEKPTDVKEVKKHYRYLKFIKSNVQDSEIEGLVKIQFKVEKSWLIDNDGVSSQIVMRRYVDGEWVDLPTKLISDDSEFVYFEAETPGFSYFAIALGDSAVDETTTTEENTATEPDSGVDDTTAGTETVTEPETEPATSPITQPKKGSFNWVLLIAGLVLVIAAILLYHHPSRKKGVSFTKKVKGSLKTKDDHEIKEVKEYVKEARKEGYSDTEIKSNLIEAGWEIELIEKMVGKDVGSDKEPKAHPDKEKSDSTKPKKKKAHKKSKH